MIMRDSVEKSKRYYGLRYVGLATKLAKTTNTQWLTRVHKIEKKMYILKFNTYYDY